MLRKFLGEFFKNWVVGMSSGCSVLFAGLFALMSSVGYSPTAHWSFGVLAVGCFGFASFYAYRSAVNAGEEAVRDIRAAQATTDAAFRSEIDTLKVQLAALLAERDRKRASVHDILDRLFQFAGEAKRLVEDKRDKAACDEWYERVSRFVAVAFGKRFSGEFVGTWKLNPNEPPHHHVNQCYQWLQGRASKISDEHLNPAFTEAMLADHPAN